jgi:hypothetical protein
METYSITETFSRCIALQRRIVEAYSITVTEMMWRKYGGIAGIMDVAGIMGIAGITGIVSITGIMGITDIAGIMGIVGITGIADITGVTGANRRHGS